MCDGFWGQLVELAVVNRDVGFSAGAVAGSLRAFNALFYVLQHRLQAFKMGAACLRALLVELAQARVRFVQQSHCAVFGHDGVHWPALRKGLTPAHRPACDCHHRQARLAQIGQGLQGLSGDGTGSGQRVINVGQDTDDALR